jgi:membrane associated rhomboid family serine protease
MNSFMGRGRFTKTLIGINLLVFLAQLASNDNVTMLLALKPASVFSEPWTIITAGFAHSGWLHLILNMYSLWIFGEAIEEFIGAKRFLWLYLASIVGGSLAFIFVDGGGWVVGASGGIFGLMGAYFIIIRSLGFRSSQMLVLIGINVVLGFTSPGIAISAHIGGLIAGAAIAWYYTVRKS